MGRIDLSKLGGRISGGKVDLKEATLIDAAGESKITGELDPDKKKISLSGKGSILSDTGPIDFSLEISGKDNIVAGKMQKIKSLSLKDEDAEVALENMRGVEKKIKTATGVVKLKKDLVIESGGVVVTGKKIDPNGNKIVIRGKDVEFDDPITYVGKTVIESSRNILINTDLHFTDETQLHLGGAVIEFGEKGRIIIDPGVLFKVQNATIKNLRSNSIVCSDHSSTIDLCNVKIIQHDDFKFKWGTLVIRGVVTFYGDRKLFLFKSPKQILIEEYGILKLKDGFTIVVKSKNNTFDMIKFLGRHSTIVLHNSEIRNESGVPLIFTVGRFVIKGRSRLAAVPVEGALEFKDPLRSFLFASGGSYDSSFISSGPISSAVSLDDIVNASNSYLSAFDSVIFFGDGSGKHDLQLYLRPSAILSITGPFLYANVNSTIRTDDSSSVINFDAGCRAVFLSDFKTQCGMAYVNSNALLLVGSGVAFKASVVAYKLNEVICR
jgi:hypothetical protein